MLKSRGRRSGRVAEGTPLLRVQVKYNWPRGFESLLLRHRIRPVGRPSCGVFLWCARHERVLTVKVPSAGGSTKRIAKDKDVRREAEPSMSKYFPT